MPFDLEINLPGDRNHNFSTTRPSSPAATHSYMHWAFAGISKIQRQVRNKSKTYLQSWSRYSKEFSREDFSQRTFEAALFRTWSFQDQ
jgi:hypothetical protein